MARVVDDMLRLLWVALLSALGVSTAGGGEPETVQAWLARMNQAVTGLDYQGEYVYLHESHLETVRIWHTVKDGIEHERLISLNGAVMELMRDDRSITCITPESRTLTVNRPEAHKRFPLLVSSDLGDLNRYYDFHHLDRCRIAGRLCRAIAVVPTDTYRYGYRLFLDEKTALPLKSDLMDGRGNPVVQMMFTSLRVSQEPPLHAQQGQRHRDRAGETSAQPLLSGRTQASEWRFRWLPDGFERRADNQWIDPNDGTKVEQIVLSDGLASMSIYIEHPGQGHADNLTGGSSVGAVNAWGRTLGAHQITAVGEVPMKTVRRVVDEIERTASD